MKRIFPLMLAGVMAVASLPVAFATNIYNSNSTETGVGTQVIYDGKSTESYTITVPAQLTPGAGGDVTLAGTWASDRVVTVTADKSVLMTNSLLNSDQQALNVYFSDIVQVGNNVESIVRTERVSVEDMPSNILFGVWSGTFYYNVSIDDLDTGIRWGQKYLLVDDIQDDGFYPDSWMIFYEDGSSVGAEVTNAAGSWVYADGVLQDPYGVWNFIVTNKGKTIICYANNGVETIYFGTYQLDEPAIEEEPIVSGLKIQEYTPTGGALTYEHDGERITVTATETLFNEFGGKDNFLAYVEQAEIKIMYFNLSGEGNVLEEITDFEIDKESGSIKFVAPVDVIYGLLIGDMQTMFSVQRIPINTTYLTMNRTYKVFWAKENTAVPDEVIFKADGTLSYKVGAVEGTEDYFITGPIMLVNNSDYTYVAYENGRVVEVVADLTGTEEVLAVFSLDGEVPDWTPVYHGYAYVCTSDTNPQKEDSLEGSYYVFNHDSSGYLTDAVTETKINSGITYTWNGIYINGEKEFEVSSDGKTLTQRDASGFVRIFECEPFMECSMLYDQIYTDADTDQHTMFTEYGREYSWYDSDNDARATFRYYMVGNVMYVLADNNQRTPIRLGYFSADGRTFYAYNPLGENPTEVVRTFVCN